MKLFFIRHGETTGDVEDRYGGSYDDHLSGKGKEQAKELGHLLKGRGIQTIFASPLIRAQQTAEILAHIIGSTVTTVSDLRERNQYGILSGMIKKDAMERYPAEVEALKDRMNTISGAESYTDFAKRIVAAFTEITHHSEYSTIAIVSHGGPMRVLYREITKWGEIAEIGNCAYVELEVINGSITKVESHGIIS